MNDVKYCHVSMNVKLADLNEIISTVNDKFDASIDTFRQVLEKDFGRIKESIMKYFVYQTSFLKNTEYDAINIITVMSSFMQALETDKSSIGDLRGFSTTPFQRISTARNDRYLEKIDPATYEQSIGTQFKQAWDSFLNIWSTEDTSNTPLSPPPEQTSIQKSAQADATFSIRVFETLLSATSKDHGVTLNTMAKVVSSLNQVKDQVEVALVRKKFCDHILERYSKGNLTASLQDFAFYPLKEMLIEVLSAADDSEDFKSAFLVVLATQKLSLQSVESTHATRLSEYYFTQPVIRNKAFWIAAIRTYAEVISDE